MYRQAAVNAGLPDPRKPHEDPIDLSAPEHAPEGLLQRVFQAAKNAIAGAQSYIGTPSTTSSTSSSNTNTNSSILSNQSAAADYDTGEDQSLLNRNRVPMNTLELTPTQPMSPPLASSTPEGSPYSDNPYFSRIAPTALATIQQQEQLLQQQQQQSPDVDVDGGAQQSAFMDQIRRWRLTLMSDREMMTESYIQIAEKFSVLATHLERGDVELVPNAPVEATQIGLSAVAATASLPSTAVVLSQTLTDVVNVVREQMDDYAGILAQRVMSLAVLGNAVDQGAAQDVQVVQSLLAHVQETWALVKRSHRNFVQVSTKLSRSNVQSALASAAGRNALTSDLMPAANLAMFQLKQAINSTSRTLVTIDQYLASESNTTSPPAVEELSDDDEDITSDSTLPTVAGVSDLPPQQQPTQITVNIDDNNNNSPRSNFLRTRTNPRSPVVTV